MTRKVVLVAYPGFQLLDLSGPADVFSAVNDLSAKGAYSLEVTAPQPGPVIASNGLKIETDRRLSEVKGPIDTLVVVGGWSTTDHLADGELVAGVARLAGRARRVASVCSGAFVLAEAGLLTGRRVTTHWMVAEELATRYPGIEVDADSIYVEAGSVWTSAGVTAGIDLSLAMVSADHGREVARKVASGLVVYLQRPGGQSQFSLPLRTGSAARDHFRDIQAYIDSHPNDDLSIDALSARVSMSPRHFTRTFTREIGLSPGRYVERSRAEAARRLLETTDDGLIAIARATGLGSPETLYRALQRHWKVSPRDYRHRFRSRATGAADQGGTGT